MATLDRIADALSNGRESIELSMADLITLAVAPFAVAAMIATGGFL